jgi:hypothetical protein
MNRLSCETVRMRLAMGDRTDDPQIGHHLAMCADCAADARLLLEIVGFIDRGLDEEVPDWLDSRVRSVFEDAPIQWRARRPRIAIVAAVTSLIAAVVGILEAQAQAGVAADDLWDSVLLVWIYLMLSGAATVPILWRYGMLRAPRFGGLRK